MNSQNTIKMIFNPGFDIQPMVNPIGFRYGSDTFGPEVENRLLKDIRKSLKDPKCDGPEVVYSIAMDVGKKKHKDILNKLHLLFGVVTYASGRLGKEPIRSQGHIHNISSYSNMSTPEVYEIWNGKAIIYMQETATDFPGRCYAVEAGPGEVVVVPPGWAHATISADPNQPLTFGAWCNREYGFDYEEVRAHKGLAWFPELNDEGIITWHKNTNYKDCELIVKKPGNCENLGIEIGKSIYQIFEEDPMRFLFVAQPQLKNDVWKNFTP